jgi:hypothetical protein
MLQHQRGQAGVGGLGGLAEPDLDRVALIAADSAAGLDDAVGEGAPSRRPSSTCSMWPMARRPIQPPLASSPAGKPQPPTSRRVPSANSTSPTLPVPIATIAPGAPPWAPIRVVKPSVSRRSAA